MTDSKHHDLRTRIAAALKAEAERRGIYRIADFDFPFMADAVIRELNIAKACESGCVWQIPNRYEDMTQAQRELLKRPDHD